MPRTNRPLLSFRRIYAGAISVCLLLSLAGCRKTFKPVETEFRSIAIPNADEFSITLKFSNPNPFAINITDFRYKVSIDTIVFAAGTRTAPLRLAPRDSTLAEFPIRPEYDRLGPALRSALNETASLIVDGDYSVATPIGTRKLKLHQESKLDIKSRLADLFQRLTR